MRIEARGFGSAHPPLPWYHKNMQIWYGIELRIQHIDPDLHFVPIRYASEFHVLAHK